MPKTKIKDLVITFLKIGTFGFGGGVAMLALIRQNVVQRKKWLSDEELTTAVALGQMLPGPFVPNYVEYIGYRLQGLKGMVFSVLAFLLPSYLITTILSLLYFSYHQLPIITNIFSGIKPVIAGILLWATFDISKTNLKSLFSIIIALIALILLLKKVDILFTILLCGGLGILIFTKRLSCAVILFSVLFLGSVVCGVANTKALELFIVFFKIGLIIFGGGFAAVPFIKYEVVDLRHWLNAQEFIDGVAISQITPGPVAILATFVGYKVLGIIGSLIATIGIFLPSFLLLLIVLLIYERLKNQPLVLGFLSGVMPAVVGMLLAATILIGRESIISLPTLIFSALTFLVLIRYKIDPVFLILAGGLFGFFGWI